MTGATPLKGKIVWVDDDLVREAVEAGLEPRLRSMRIQIETWSMQAAKIGALLDVVGDRNDGTVAGAEIVDAVLDGASAMIRELVAEMQNGVSV